MSQKRARTARSQSTAPRRAPRVVRAMGPADLLRHVPELLPVDPADSLVLILFRRSQGTRSRTHGGMRVDLLHTEDQEELEAWAAAILGRALHVEGVTGVAIAAYTPDTFAPSGRPPAAAQVRAVGRQAERMGLEVLDRFCIGADGWGSLGDPDLPRGGHPLALLEPDEPRGSRVDPLAPVERAPARDVRSFRDAYDAWWRRPEGPGGPLHGVDLGGPGRVGASITGSPRSSMDLPPHASALDRYRFGHDVLEVVELVEGILEPHDAAAGPCACRALLASLVERQGLIGLLLVQAAWGPAFGREVWTAFAAPAERRRSVTRMMDALMGRHRRPDLDRLDAAAAALREVAALAELPRIAAGVDEALAWLAWARGASSPAAGLAERALDRRSDRDLAPILLQKVQRGELPGWAFRRDAGRPDPFEALLDGRRIA